MTKLFNSTFELSLRVLLLLSVSDNTSMTIDRIAAYDFIIIYNRNFGLSNSNLHGDNDFSFSEFATRRILMQDALKSLVLDNLVNVVKRDDGFHYKISGTGRGICKSQTTEYVEIYRRLALETIAHFKSKSEVEILNIISKESTKALKR